MNPLAEVRAKGHNVCRLVTVALLAFTMGACSDDDDEVTVQFPELQELTCNVGETKDLTFKASSDWQLTSSALWCKFVVDGAEDYAVSGVAGDQTVAIKIDEEAQSHAVTSADITLTMGMQKAVIAKVVRAAQGYELKVYDEAGKEIKEIEVGYSNFKPFTVKANFHFAVTNRPSWVEIDGGALSGVANKETTGALRAIENGITEKYPVTAADKQQLVFADEDGKVSFTYPLVFKGMDAKEIKITAVTNNPWDWTVSLDGKQFLQESTSGLTGEASKNLYKNRLPFTIKALNDDYEIVYMQKVELMPGMFNYAIGADEGVDWMSFDKKTMSLSVDASTEEREGFVLAFPAAVYNEIKDDLWGNLIESTTDMETGMNTQELKYEYAENNLLLNFVQKDKKEEGGTASDANVKVSYFDENWMTVEAEVVKVTDEGITSEFGIPDIYSVDGTVGNSYFINPMLDGDWTYAAFLDNEGDDVAAEYCEPTENQLNVWLGEMESGHKLYVMIRQNEMNARVIIFEK